MVEQAERVVIRVTRRTHTPPAGVILAHRAIMGVTSKRTSGTSRAVSPAMGRSMMVGLAERVVIRVTRRTRTCRTGAILHRRAIMGVSLSRTSGIFPSVSPVTGRSMMAGRAERVVTHVTRRTRMPRPGVILRQRTPMETSSRQDNGMHLPANHATGLSMMAEQVARAAIRVMHPIHIRSNSGRLDIRHT